MKRLFTAAFASFSLAACATYTGEQAQNAKILTLEDGTLFPADNSLVRPEDGVVLADGRLIVADQRHGLILLRPDGSHRPFGNFGKAGYVHNPPSQSSGPNGVALDHDGAHILVADIFTGSIYQTDIETETTQRIYQHNYGTNSAHTDSTGALWFTQSTENNGPESEARMFAAVNIPMGDGALYRVPPSANGKYDSVPELKAGGLNFANGFVIDEARGALYLSETANNNVHEFQIDPDTGQLGDRRILAKVATPDNIEIDDNGHIWVASPIANEVAIIDPERGTSRSVFRPHTAEREPITAEWNRRSIAGEPRIDLLGPDVWGDMPGLLTGVILTPGGGPVYISGLGNALVKLDR